MDIDDIYTEKKDEITKRYKEIVDKLGFDIQSYNNEDNLDDAHERDNIPNPFDKLSLEELLFLRDYGFLS